MIDYVSYREILELLPSPCGDLRYDIADALNLLVDKINEELKELHELHKETT